MAAVAAAAHELAVGLSGEEAFVGRGAIKLDKPGANKLAALVVP